MMSLPNDELSDEEVQIVKEAIVHAILDVYPGASVDLARWAVDTTSQAGR